MSIEICVKDPANTNPKELGLVVDMINYFIANNTYSGVAIVYAPAAPLATEDHPSAGHEVVSPQAAFSSAEGNPAAAFADSNPAAAFALPQAATGNVQAVAAPSLPQNGTPPAPSSTVQTVGANTGHASVELDKNGLPWDVRIHAKADGGGGSKNKDGTWRTKRGVDPALVDSVTAELRRVMALPGAAPAPFVGNAIPHVPAPPAPPAPPAGDTFLVGVAPPGAPVGFQEPATPAAPVVAAAPAVNFLELAGKIGAAVASGKLTQTEIVTACNTFGLADLTQLPLRPELVPSVNMMVDQYIAAKG